MRIEPRLSLVAFAASVIAVHGCSSAAPPPSVAATVDTDCARHAAFVPGRVFGTSLPPHSIALTFDDGPAARTVELAAYLQAEGIPAAFFVNGMWVAQQPGVLPQVVAYGHLIGNHTQEHQDLTSGAVYPATPTGDAAMVAAVSQTDALIAPYLEGGRRLFRAPFGQWNVHAYTVLDASPMNAYVGPIEWEIGDTRTATTAADWACWQVAPPLSTKACGDLYLAQITQVDRGIVLLHDGPYGDESNHALTTGVGNTVDMVKYMVPVLKAAGFAFVRVDRVPAIEAKLPPLDPLDPPAPPDPPGPPEPPDAGDSADAADGAPATPDAPAGATPSKPEARPVEPTPTPASSMTDDPCASPSRARSRDHAH